MPTAAATGFTTFRPRSLPWRQTLPVRPGGLTRSRRAPPARRGSAAAAATSAAKGRRSPPSSGCHCTPEDETGASGSSTASMTPSPARGGGRSPRPSPVDRLVVRAQHGRARAEDAGSVAAGHGRRPSPPRRRRGRVRWVSLPMTSGRCWCSVPPSSTLRTWQPRQMASTGRSAARAAASSARSLSSRTVLTPATARRGRLAVGGQGPRRPRRSAPGRRAAATTSAARRSRPRRGRSGAAGAGGAAAGGRHQLVVGAGEHRGGRSHEAPGCVGHIGGDADERDPSTTSVQNGWTGPLRARHHASCPDLSSLPRDRRRIDRHRHRGLSRHARPAGRQAGHARVLHRRTWPSTALRSATTCWPSTST